LLYPQEEIFSADNFSRCPLILIEQALEVATQRQLELSAAQAVPLASVGISMLGIAGIKGEEDWFNPFSAALFEQEAQKICSPNAAWLFLELGRLGKLPSWVASYCDLKLIQAAAKYADKHS